MPRLLTCFVWSIAVLTACGETASDRGEPPGDGPFAELVREAREAGDTSPGAQQAFPSLGCVGEPRTSVAARVVAQRLEERMTDGWAPSRVVDIARTRTGFVAVDEQAAELAWLSEDLAAFRVVARKGSGPGELQNPVAVAFDPGSGVTWVLDTRPPRLIAFDAALAYARSFRLQDRASDVAVTADGRLIVASDIMVPMLRANPERTAAYAWMYDGEGEQLDVLRSMTFQDIGSDSRFNLPGPTEVRVAAGNGRVVIYYPASGYLEVGSGAADDFRMLEVCVSPEVREAYERQLSDFDESRPTQVSLQLIADVRLVRDSVVVLSGLMGRGGSPYTEHIPLGGGSKHWRLISGDVPAGHGERLVDGGRIMIFSAAGDFTILDLDESE